MTRILLAPMVLAGLVVAACGSTPPPAPTPRPSNNIVTLPPATPTPSGPSCLTPPGPASTLTGIGADTATWNAHHTPDPNDPIAYNPQPNAFPGAPVQDVFGGVTFTNGRVNEFQHLFAPMTSQASAEQAVLQDLPTDACPLYQPTALGTCAGQYFLSSSLGSAEAAAGGPSGGVISVAFDSTYGGAPVAYNPADVRGAFLLVAPGSASDSIMPAPGSVLADAFCGG